MDCDDCKTRPCKGDKEKCPENETDDLPEVVEAKQMPVRMLPAVARGVVV